MIYVWYYNDKKNFVKSRFPLFQEFMSNRHSRIPRPRNRKWGRVFCDGVFECVVDVLWKF